MKSKLLFLSLLIMGCAQLTPTPPKVFNPTKNWGFIIGGKLSSEDVRDETLRNNAQDRMLEEIIRDLLRSALAKLCILVNGKSVASFINSTNN